MEFYTIKNNLIYHCFQNDPKLYMILGNVQSNHPSYKNSMPTLLPGVLVSCNLCCSENPWNLCKR